jgi:hypothetical protein
VNLRCREDSKAHATSKDARLAERHCYACDDRAAPLRVSEICVAGGNNMSVVRAIRRPRGQISQFKYELPSGTRRAEQRENAAARKVS